jgi:hypothetical protein
LLLVDVEHANFLADITYCACHCSWSAQYA